MLVFAGLIAGPAQATCASNEYTTDYYAGYPFLDGSPVIAGACESGPEIGHDWGAGNPGGGMPNDLWSARWQGSFDFDATTYTFSLGSDDGSRLYVDNTLVIDGWSDHGFTTLTGHKALTAGSHTVKVEYYESGGDAKVDFSFAKPTLAPAHYNVAGYGDYNQGLPTSHSYLPIAGWFPGALNQTEIDAEDAFGMNVFYGVEDPENVREDLIRSSGMRTIIQTNEKDRFDGNASGESGGGPGSERAGYLVHDEPDMNLGPGNDTWNETSSGSGLSQAWPNGCTGAGSTDQDHGAQCGYTAMTTMAGRVPSHSPAWMKFLNYGKGVLETETDTEAGTFVNGSWQNSTSADLYYFSDPSKGSERYGYKYGDSVRRMIALDDRDSTKQPIWNLVETGWPWSETTAQGGRRILPAEAKSAVWHSIIGGAQGITYFDLNFSPDSCAGSTIRDDCYDDTHDELTAVNANLTSLAPVINAPTLTVGVDVSSNIRALVKRYQGDFYVFAGATTGSATGTVTIPCLGTATATRIAGESGTVSIGSDGELSDSYADKNAVHIYRVTGGSDCGFGDTAPASLGTTASSSNTNTYTLNTTKAVAPGGRVSVAVGAVSDNTLVADNPLSSVSGGGLTFHEEKAQNGVEGIYDTDVAVWSAYAPNGLASGTTLTAGFANITKGIVMGAVSIPSTESTSPVDVTSSTFRGTPTGTWSTGSATTTHAADTLLGVGFGDGGTFTSSPVSGTTELADFRDPVEEHALTITTKDVSSTGSQSLSGTWSSTPGFADAGVMVAYKKP